MASINARVVSQAPRQTAARGKTQCKNTRDAGDPMTAFFIPPWPRKTTGSVWLVRLALSSLQVLPRCLYTVLSGNTALDPVSGPSSVFSRPPLTKELWTL
jgi:hypothetical protein